MLKINKDLECALKEYLTLLKQEAYFKAHEVLEEAWHHLRLNQLPLTNLVKGFINGAIAFEHLKRNRKNMPQKVKKVIASYERYKIQVEDNIEYKILFVEARNHIEMLKNENQEIFFS